jgi:hypothetical protein
MAVGHIARDLELIRKVALKRLASEPRAAGACRSFPIRR